HLLLFQRSVRIRRRIYKRHRLHHRRIEARTKSLAPRSRVDGSMGSFRTAFTRAARSHGRRAGSRLASEEQTMNQSIPSIDQIDKYVARLNDRVPDWNVLDFQTKTDPKYRRAQMRYVGGGGTGKHDDPKIIKAGHFTLSTMI